MFRLKSISNDGGSQSTLDTYLTALTPFGQSGTFGALEPSMTPITMDFTIPTPDNKWNQIIELQLPNGHKVFFISFSKNLIVHINHFQMIVDRTTWISDRRDKSPLMYRLDTQLLIPLYINSSKRNSNLHISLFLEIQWVVLVFVVVVH